MIEWLQYRVRNVYVIISSGAEIQVRLVASVEIGSAGHKKSETIGKPVHDAFVKGRIRGVIYLKSFQTGST